MKIIFIIGLPCSGKSWLANKLSLSILPNIPIVDDFECLNKNFILSLKNGYIFTHPWLCIPRILNEEIIWVNNNFDNPVLEFIYFENNPIKCMKNLEYRMKNGDRRNVELSIKALTSQYIIPQNITPLPIWTKN